MALGTVVAALPVVSAVKVASATPAMPTFTVYDNAGALFDNAGGLVTDDLACITGADVFPPTPFVELVLGGVVVTHSGTGTAGTSVAHPAAANGHAIVWGAADPQPNSLTLTFTFGEPVSAFGLTDLNFGNGGPGRPGDLAVSTDTGLNQVIDSNGGTSEAGRDVFIGVTSDVPFNQLSLTTTHVNDITLTDQLVVPAFLGTSCNPNPTPVSFASFTAKADIESKSDGKSSDGKSSDRKSSDGKSDDDSRDGSKGDKFKLRKGIFELGIDSDGIDLSNEDLTLQIGSASVTVLAGVLEPKGSKFRFKGVIDGDVKLDLEIKETSEGVFEIKADGEGLDLSGVTITSTVRLTIGDDAGDAVVTWKFK